MTLRSILKTSAMGAAICAVMGLGACSASLSDLGMGNVHPALSDIGKLTNPDLPSLLELPSNSFSAKTSAWWENFQDPLLNHLVSEGINRSLDVRRALIDVERSEALIRAGRADLLPQLDLGLRGATNSTALTPQTSLNANWDLDIFGQTRQQIKSEQSRTQRSRALVRDTQRLVLARIVQSYIGLRATQARIELNKKNLARLEQNTQKIKKLVDGGYNTRLDLSRSQNQFFGLRTNLASLQSQETALLNSLAQLTNIAPRTLTEELKIKEAQYPRLPNLIPEPELEHILRNRPDIRAAEWALVSATQSERAARLSLLPDISLGGQIFTTGEISDFPSLDSLTSNLIGNLALPILGRGRLLAGIDSATANVKGAGVDYEQTVTNALLDIDSAIAQWQRSQDRLHYNELSLNSAVEAQELAEKLFYAGEQNFTALIVAEQTRLSAEDNFLRARQEAFESYINYAASAVPNW